jgi:hypothetical protein
MDPAMVPAADSRLSAALALALLIDGPLKARQRRKAVR